MKRVGLLLVLLILASVAGGCISQSGTPTTSPTTTISPSPTTTTTSAPPENGPELPGGNYTPIYTGSERGCPSGRVPVTFTYDPGNRTVTSVSLRGSFNDWGEWQMEKEGGIWKTTVCLAPGKYQYKYFINGQWVKDMSDDGTGRPYDPEADGYVGDGYGGKNAVRIVEGSATFYVDFEPGDPAYLSVADNRTVIRFEAKRGTVSSAVLVTGRGNYTMELQV